MDNSLAVGNTLLIDVDDRIEHEVILHDDSLRDGEQTVGVAFSQETKLELARKLVAAGLKSISLGFPVVSEKEAETVRTIAKEVKGANFTCLARARPEDVELISGCGVSTVAMFVGISDPHLRKLKIDEDTAFRRMQEQIPVGVANGMSVRFGLEDASRAPLERIKRFVEGALEVGADIVVIPDTCGILTPVTTERLVRSLREVADASALAAHFHNDLGMATANSLVAVACGMGMTQGTLCGIGERAGNTRLEEFAVAATVKYDCLPTIDLVSLLGAANWLREKLDWPVPPNQPITGANVFAHEAGIHVHGLMQDPCTYEPFPPALLGAEHEFKFGKHAGLSNIQFVANGLGGVFEKDVQVKVLEEVKRLGEMGERVTRALVEALLRAATPRKDA